jgi:peptidoglycan/LPS O-acetylase OafA/YrhL
MKKLLLIFCLVLVSFVAFSQVPPTPDTPWEALGQFSTLIGTLGGSVALMFFFVPFVLGALNVQGKFLKYLVMVLAVTAIVLAGYFFEFGYLFGAEWWVIPLNLASLVLIQIGYFSFPFIEDLQDKIYDKFNPWK